MNYGGSNKVELVEVVLEETMKKNENLSFLF